MPHTTARTGSKTTAKKKRDSLATYRDKRDFRKSPEPSGKRSGKGKVEADWKKTGNPFFVIHKHDASHLHYDFRVQVGRVLKSWAVPKGPSTDPRQKRLAIRVEDHPIGYADFEGVIPQGEYGGGTVIVWDAGPYRNIKTDENGHRVSMSKALAMGAVEIWLEGKKLRGGYALVRTKMGGDPRNWLLIKMNDEAKDARRNPVRSQARSVLSGRTIAEVAREERRDTDMWPPRRRRNQHRHG